MDLIGHIQGVHQSSVTGGSTGIKARQMDTATLARTTGHEGEQNGAVYKATIDRADLQVNEMGAAINARMGLNSWRLFSAAMRMLRSLAMWRCCPVK